MIHDFNVCHTRCVCNYMRGNIVKNTTCLEKMLYTLKNETTCFGLCWPSSGFHITLRRVYNTTKLQNTLTQFWRLFLKYCGNLKMANKGRNMYLHFLEYITSFLKKLCFWLYSLSWSDTWVMWANHNQWKRWL